MRRIGEIFLTNTIRRIGIISDFDPRDHLSDKEEAEPPIYIEDDFEELFFRGLQIPTTFPPIEVRSLEAGPPELSDEEILELIGGDRIETHLGIVHHFIKLQSSMQGGILLLRPAINFFFVAHPNGKDIVRVHVMDREPGERWTVGVTEFNAGKPCKSSDQLFVSW